MCWRRWQINVKTSGQFSFSNLSRNFSMLFALHQTVQEFNLVDVQNGQAVLEACKQHQKQGQFMYSITVLQPIVHLLWLHSILFKMKREKLFKKYVTREEPESNLPAKTRPILFPTVSNWVGFLRTWSSSWLDVGSWIGRIWRKLKSVTSFGSGAISIEDMVVVLQQFFKLNFQKISFQFLQRKVHFSITLIL